MKACYIVSILFLFACFTGTSVNSEAGKIADGVSVDRIMNDIREIINPEFTGRLAGTDGFDLAAEWAAKRFKEIGVKPLFNDYFQEFPISSGEIEDFKLSLFFEDSRETILKEGKDYKPFYITGFGDVEAEIIFAGYGINAPELEYNDYRGLDVKGKIVLVNAGIPRLKGKNFMPYVRNRAKAREAAQRGAKGLLVVSRRLIYTVGDHLEGLPMMLISGAQAEMIFARSGRDHKKISKEMTGGNSTSFTTGVKAHMKITGKLNLDDKTFNVVAALPGSDPQLKHEYIVFGAHLDHLGKIGKPIEGANDNASGSAMVLELARAFKALKTPPKRSIIFALFSAEEYGLTGSRELARKLKSSEMKTLYLLNFDICGRGASLYVEGAKENPEFYEFVEKAKDDLGLDFNMKSGGYFAIPSSDAHSFKDAGIPAYSNFVFGPGRPLYHTREDTINNLTPEIMRDIVKAYFLAGYEYLNR